LPANRTAYADVYRARLLELGDRLAGGADQAGGTPDRRRNHARESARVLCRTLDEMAADMEQDPECPDPALFDTLREVEAAPPKPGLSALTWYDKAARTMLPVPEVAILRVPTTDRHTIPLYLDWGGWNAVPSSHDLAAVARYWHETHGADLVAVGSDTLEFTVARRPANHAEAAALLKEQYLFAPDNWECEQGVLEQAAAELRAADSWTFWWD
jgi:hypothetical protein